MQENKRKPAMEGTPAKAAETTKAASTGPSETETTNSPDTGEASGSAQGPAKLIAGLKAEGVSFEGCGEEEAFELLCGPAYFEQVSCYLPLFERRVGGPRDGQFVNLDFSQLLALRRAEGRVGAALLTASL